MPRSARDVIDEYYGSENVVLPIDVIGIANAHGINVYRANFHGDIKDDIFGFIEKDSDTTSIYVNAQNAPTRRRFTIAHELGHYFLRHEGNDELKYLDLRSTKSTPEEIAANQFAAELLIPESELRKEYNKLLFPTVEALAKIFNVSKQAMKYRLSNLRLSVVDI